MYVDVHTHILYLLHVDPSLFLHTAYGTERMTNHTDAHIYLINQYTYTHTHVHTYEHMHTHKYRTFSSITVSSESLTASSKNMYICKKYVNFYCKQPKHANTSKIVSFYCKQQKHVNTSKIRQFLLQATKTRKYVQKCQFLLQATKIRQCDCHLVQTCAIL